jgi:hypothetical protein
MCEGAGLGAEGEGGEERVRVVRVGSGQWEGGGRGAEQVEK